MSGIVAQCPLKVHGVWSIPQRARKGAAPRELKQCMVRAAFSDFGVGNPQVC